MTHNCVNDAKIKAIEMFRDPLDRVHEVERVLSYQTGRAA